MMDKVNRVFPPAQGQEAAVDASPLRISSAEDALDDLLALENGGLAGKAQVAGVVLEAAAALRGLLVENAALRPDAQILRSMADTPERGALLARMREYDSRYGQTGSAAAYAEAERCRALIKAMDRFVPSAYSEAFAAGLALGRHHGENSRSEVDVESRQPAPPEADAP